ncbi:MAG: hypothetical protein NE327_09860, partial [Lentisphaeraceae bacterium]|nr:hypothetical protein [Lentisphaeraceae bacterium]
MKSNNLLNRLLKRAVVISGGLFLSMNSTNAATPIGHYQIPVGEAGAEIISYDDTTQTFAVTNAEESALELLSLSSTGSLSPFGTVLMLGSINSVSCRDGFAAIAVEGVTKQSPGSIVIVDIASKTIVKSYPAGALPDMITFSPDGNKLIAANEGEPDDDFEVNPEGSVTVVDVSNGMLNGVVTQIGFTSFNDKKEELRNAGLKLYSPKISGGSVIGEASVAEDLEPEYVAVSPDSKKAFISCQENNAVAV